MLAKLFAWIATWWYAFKDARHPHVKIHEEWRYDKRGDTRRDE
jgi:hypothetical protein